MVVHGFDLDKDLVKIGMTFEEACEANREQVKRNKKNRDEKDASRS